MATKSSPPLKRDEIWLQTADEFNQWELVDRESRYNERLFWLALCTGALTFGAFCFALGAIVAGA